MKKINIRNGIFETNSSSTHALCISKNPVTNYPKKVNFTHDEFGWENEIYSSINKRASYLYQCICDVYDESYDKSNKEKKDEMLTHIKNVLNQHNIECTFEEYDNGYIDHASCNSFITEVTNNDDLLIRWLLGDSLLITGNDNNDTFENTMSTIDVDNYDMFYKGN